MTSISAGKYIIIILDDVLEVIGFKAVGASRRVALTRNPEFQILFPLHRRATSHVNVLNNDKDIYVLVPSRRMVRFADEESIHTLSHAVYRQPVKVIFPKPAFKQQEF